MKYSITLLFLLIVACTRPSSTALQQWETDHKISYERPPQRHIANEETNTCEEIYSSREQIMKIVEREEKSYVDSIKGIEKNKNIQSYLYEIFKITNPFAFEENDLVQCNSVICLYDKYYGSTSLASPYAYIWWLRTGSALAVVNELPGIEINKKLAPFKFSESEIINITTLILATENIGSKTLKYLYRLPKDFVWSEFPSSCGLASSLGWIQMADKCMQGEYAKLTVLHEIGHHKDYAQGSPSNPYGVSQTKKWLGFSGWHTVEFKDPVTGLTIEQKWIFQIGNGYDGFTRDYALKSPQEDWADSVSYYRNQYEKFKTIAPHKSDYVSKNIFNEKEYDKYSILQNLISVAKNKSQENFKSLALECSQFQKSDEIQKCIENKIEKQFIIGTKAVAYDNYSSCLLLKKYLNDFKLEIKASLSQLVDNADVTPNKFLRRVQANLEYSKALSTLDQSSAVIACFQQNDATDCFLKKLTEQAQSLMPTDKKEFTKSLEDTRNQYLTQNYYELALQKTIVRYKNMFSKAVEGLQKFAEIQWEQCSQTHLEENNESISASTSQNIYMHPSIELCLNQKINKSLVRFVTDTQPKYSIQDLKTLSFIENIFTEDIWNIWMGLAQKEFSEEKNQYQKIEAMSKSYFKKNLLQDKQWIRETTPLYDSCRGTIQKKMMSDTPAGVLTSIHKLKFIPQKEFVRITADNICTEFAEKSELKVLFSGTASEQSNESLRFLTSAIKKRALEHTKCEPGFISGFLQKWELVSIETSCALQSSQQIAKEAFQDWEQSAYGQKFSSDSSHLWTYVITNITSLIKAATAKPPG